MGKINRCPNCGYEEEEGAKFCRNCGSPIDDEPIESEFEYDFGEAEASAVSGVSPVFTMPAAEPSIALNLDVNKANKYKKEVFSWSIFIIVASALGLILNLTSLSDTQELQSYLPLIREEFYGLFSTAINVYYAGVVLLALLIVAAIVLLVFSLKLNKFTFPVQDDAVFGVAKQTFFASIAVTVVEAVLFIVELIAVINVVQMQMTFEDIDLNISLNIVYLVKDLIVLGGTVLMMIYSMKLAKSKQN